MTDAATYVVILARIDIIVDLQLHHVQHDIGWIVFTESLPASSDKNLFIVQGAHDRRDRWYEAFNIQEYPCRRFVEQDLD